MSSPAPAPTTVAPADSSPEVSVLMPVRDGGRWLEAAVRSVLDQSFAALELVVVDDGSRDGSDARVADVARTDRRVRLIRQPPLGIVAALRRAAGEARAPLLARMDADDLCAPGRLAAQLALLADGEPDLVAVSCLVDGTEQTADEDHGGWRQYLEWVNGCIDAETFARELFVESPLPHPTVVMRREAYERVGGYRAFDGPEDYDLWLRLAAAGGRFAKVPEVLLRWRDRPGRLTRTDRRYRAEAFARLKAGYLASGPLRAVAHRPLCLWGAGRYGRHLGRALEAAGVTIEAFVDIDPRKIGRTRRGDVPVIDPEALLGIDGAFVLGAVPLPEARARIRAFLERAGRREGRDYIVCA